jgi:hypothetical protein
MVCLHSSRFGLQRDLTTGFVRSSPSLVKQQDLVERKMLDIVGNMLVLSLPGGDARSYNPPRTSLTACCSLTSAENTPSLEHPRFFDLDWIFECMKRFEEVWPLLGVCLFALVCFYLVWLVWFVGRSLCFAYTLKLQASDVRSPRHASKRGSQLACTLCAAAMLLSLLPSRLRRQGGSLMFTIAPSARGSERRHAAVSDDTHQ